MVVIVVGGGCGGGGVFCRQAEQKARTGVATPVHTGDEKKQLARRRKVGTVADTPVSPSVPLSLSLSPSLPLSLSLSLSHSLSLSLSPSLSPPSLSFSFSFVSFFRYFKILG